MTGIFKTSHALYQHTGGQETSMEKKKKTEKHKDTIMELH